jgi:rare lipoprotein A
MSSIDHAKRSNVARSYVAIEAGPVRGARPVSAARVRNVFQLLAVVIAAASLAACAQSNAVRNSGLASPNRHASLNHDQATTSFTSRRIASTRRHTPFARSNTASPTKIASQGVASFYTEDQMTASGEKFNTNDLTAAHPTLPFGTRLRVTNVTTGRSVTVRVNDRGPYVPGRIVDVSHSAANALGMVESGIAKVKLDVVQ